jgi:hypothetical protein
MNPGRIPSSINGLVSQIINPIAVQTDTGVPVTQGVAGGVGRVDRLPFRAAGKGDGEFQLLEGDLAGTPERVGCIPTWNVGTRKNPPYAYSQTGRFYI